MSYLGFLMVYIFILLNFDYVGLINPRLATFEYVFGRCTCTMKNTTLSDVSRIGFIKSDMYILDLS